MKNFLLTCSLILWIFFINGFSYVVKAQTVSGLLDKETVKRGKMAGGKIIIAIPDELHVNSNIPNDEFAIPTTVKISASNIRIGKISYPKGKIQKFDFSEKPLSVYEGNIIIKFTFFIPANFKNKKVKINAAVQFQVCNQEVCFAPKTKKITLFAKIK